MVNGAGNAIMIISPTLSRHLRAFLSLPRLSVPSTPTDQSTTLGWSRAVTHLLRLDFTIVSFEISLVPANPQSDRPRRIYIEGRWSGSMRTGGEVSRSPDEQISSLVQTLEEAS